MRSGTMKSSSVKRSHKRVVQMAVSSEPTAEFVRLACDEFIELRREHVNIGENRLVGGFAIIGRHSALIIIHGDNGRRGKNRIPESACGRASGFRNAEHLMQLAHKFRQPIIVCFVPLNHMRPWACPSTFSLNGISTCQSSSSSSPARVRTISSACGSQIRVWRSI
jgi:hypothetical protein